MKTEEQKRTEFIEEMIRFMDTLTESDEESTLISEVCLRVMLIIHAYNDDEKTKDRLCTIVGQALIHASEFCQKQDASDDTN